LYRNRFAWATHFSRSATMSCLVSCGWEMAFGFFVDLFPCQGDDGREVPAPGHRCRLAAAREGSPYFLIILIG
jgi:hypothetical protein